MKRWEWITSIIFGIISPDGARTAGKSFPQTQAPALQSSCLQTEYAKKQDLSTEFEDFERKSFKDPQQLSSHLLSMPNYTITNTPDNEDDLCR